MRICHPPEKEETNRSLSSGTKPNSGMILSINLSMLNKSMRSAWRCSSFNLSTNNCVNSALGLSSNAFCTRSRFFKTSDSSPNEAKNSSLTVFEPFTSNSCVKYPIFTLFANKTSPSSCSISPMIIFSCVVFPAPFHPTRPTRSPFLQSQVTSDNTSWFVNVFLMFSTRTPVVTAPAVRFTDLFLSFEKISLRCSGIK